MVNNTIDRHSNQLNTWIVKKNFSYKKKTKKELNDLVNKIVKEFKAKGHIENFSGQIQSDPHWNELVTNTATGTVNVLLSLGGPLREIEHLISKLFPVIYPNVINFVNPKNKTPLQRLINHIKFMAGAYPAESNRPKTGLTFESSASIKDIGPETYIRAIKTWQEIKLR
jgi:hypothetical protein